MAAKLERKRCYSVPVLVLRDLADGGGCRHYFDGRGRAEPIRWMLEETATPYSENIIRTRADMASLRQTGKLLYGQVPMLEIDGLCIVQCEAILHYLARKHDMMGRGLAESVRAIKTPLTRPPPSPPTPPAPVFGGDEPCLTGCA